MRVRFLKKFAAVAGIVAGLFTLALPAAAQPVPPNPTQEQIQTFASRITVNEDGTIVVDETIGYYFPSPRHGFYRDLPLRYDIDGKTVEMPISDIDVHYADLSPVPFTTETNKNALRIKVGDPNLTVEGLQTYDITYAVSGALRYFSDHDELYWNVTGDRWTVPIGNVSASVVPPVKAARNLVTTKCYTGPTGSTASDCLAPPSVGESADFASSNGPLTVVVGWPPGLVAKLMPKSVSPLEKAVPFVPFVLPILAIIGLYFLWRAKGRDPKGSPTLVVQYDPPAGMTPAEMGAIYTESETAKDLSSTIVHLAVRGYLVIREVENNGPVLKNKDYEFERLKDFQNDPALKSFEKQVLTTLFDGDGKIARVSDITAGHTFYMDIPKIQAAVFAQLVGDGYFPADPMKVKAAYAGPAILVIFIAFLFFPGAGMLFSGTLSGNISLAIVISVAAVGIAGQFMTQRTVKGVEARDHAAGFLEYLKTAEKYRMQWQEKENIFEKYLPYAMAFGVVDKWSKTFASMNLPPPQWYRGSSFSSGAFNAGAFSSSMNSMSTAMSAAMQSQPQSSGGGSGFSGGFSGGGGGGGGGGSW